MSALGQMVETQVSRVDGAMSLAARHLLKLQKAEGFWWGDLTADSTLESDFILMELWLYPPAPGQARWEPPTRSRVDKACRRILSQQLPDGGFNIYAGGPADVSATTKAYFALKVSGCDVDEPCMRAARERILALGGFQACNSYVKLNLSFFGLYPRQFVPSIPPEMMLVPGGWLYEMSSWSRAIVVPLSVVHANDPKRPVPEGFNLEELFRPDIPLSFPKAANLISWRNFFYGVDAGLKLWDRFGSAKLRKMGVERAMAWALERTQQSDGLGAIYPAMMYMIMALDLMGYSRESEEFREALGQFERLKVETDDDLFFQPCFSPVWDTAIAAFSLADSGMVERGALRDAADWLLTKEVRRKGDWSVKRPNTEPSGWYFEFANEFYPDIDDTGMVLMALARTEASDPAAQRACIDRAVNWLLDMQSSDGGWAAFDVDNNLLPLSYIPFADHNAMLDPTCADITGRVMEALIMCGVDPQHRAIRRGVEYLRKTQEPDGSWYGRWGVNYLYGTCFALRGLRAAGESDREAHMLRAGEWLRSIQNADGGWGEDCLSYATGEFAAAESTPTQTSWALMGLISSGDNYSSSVRKAVDFLVNEQLPSGGWDERLSTGTGFPRVFYLTYHYYRHTFPLMALACYRNSLGESD